MNDLAVLAVVEIRQCKHTHIPGAVDHRTGALQLVGDQIGEGRADLPIPVGTGIGHVIGNMSDRRSLGIDSQYGRIHRSEEHTSELQSLMRISYAVFCLKKKINIYQSSATTHL